jgi:hypothetical protein
MRCSSGSPVTALEAVSGSPGAEGTSSIRIVGLQGLRDDRFARDPDELTAVKAGGALIGLACSRSQRVTCSHRSR